MYYTYVLRCEDNSLYTGITTDVNRRLEEHKSSPLGAKYTKRHIPVSIEAYWQSETRALASKLEYHLKRLKKENKEELIKDKDNISLDRLLGLKLEIDKYIKIK